MSKQWDCYDTDKKTYDGTTPSDNRQKRDRKNRIRTTDHPTVL